MKLVRPPSDREGVAENARLVCTAFDAGKGVYRVGLGLNELGLTVEQAGHLMGAAVQASCPEHLERFSGWSAGRRRLGRSHRDPATTDLSADKFCETQWMAPTDDEEWLVVHGAPDDSRRQDQDR